MSTRESCAVRAVCAMNERVPSVVDAARAALVPILPPRHGRDGVARSVGVRPATVVRVATGSLESVAAWAGLVRVLPPHLRLRAAAPILAAAGLLPEPAAPSRLTSSAAVVSASARLNETTATLLADGEESVSDRLAIRAAAFAVAAEVGPLVRDESLPEQLRLPVFVGV